jgi:hypothetical protein
MTWSGCGPCIDPNRGVASAHLSNRLQQPSPKSSFDKTILDRLRSAATTDEVVRHSLCFEASHESFCFFWDGAKRSRSWPERTDMKLKLERELL